MSHRESPRVYVPPDHQSTEITPKSFLREWSAYNSTYFQFSLTQYASELGIYRELYLQLAKAVEEVPATQRFFVLMDVSARTGP